MSLPAYVAPAVQRLLAVPDGTAFAPADLSDLLDPTSRLVLVRRLVREVCSGCLVERLPVQ
jgi:hypothetical protein